MGFLTSLQNRELSAEIGVIQGAVGAEVGVLHVEERGGEFIASIWLDGERRGGLFGIVVFFPMHEFIWELAGGYCEESANDWTTQTAKNVLIVPFHGSAIDATHSPTTTISGPSWGATGMGS